MTLKQRDHDMDIGHSRRGDALVSCPSTPDLEEDYPLSAHRRSRKSQDKSPPSTELSRISLLPPAQFHRRVSQELLREVSVCLNDTSPLNKDAIWKTLVGQLSLKEICVNLSLEHTKATLDCVSEAVIHALRQNLATLQTLRLRGSLDLNMIFRELKQELPSTRAEKLANIQLVQGPKSSWDIDVSDCLADLSGTLQRLQVVFLSEESDVPEGFCTPLADLKSLKHLALSHPLRSAIPPLGDLPTAIGELTHLTSLQLRRTPLQSHPMWMGNLLHLEHLYYDPFLPICEEPAPPIGLSLLTSLKSLFLDMMPPYIIPDTLKNVERLAIVTRPCDMHNRDEESSNKKENWEWLSSMTKLSSLTLRGCGLKKLPDPIIYLGLTRLEVNLNRLSELPVGRYLENLQFLHLGSNAFINFPKAIQRAKNLRQLHIANQICTGWPAVMSNSGQLGRALSVQALSMTAADVQGLLNMPQLEVMVKGMHHLIIQPNNKSEQWLRVLLRQRNKGKGARLTSSELVYKMEDWGALFEI